MNKSINEKIFNMEELQEKTLQHETETLEIVESRTPFAELDEPVKFALHCASEKKAIKLAAIDLRKIADFTEFFIIASGTNTRQVQAIADEIEDKLKSEYKTRPSRIEGYHTAEWILMDYGDFVVHVFEQKAREFYDLDRLWRDAQRVELPDEL
jgi:ribosome-associated protein